MDLQNTAADADAQYIRVGQACETDTALPIDAVPDFPIDAHIPFGVAIRRLCRSAEDYLAGKGRAAVFELKSSLYNGRIRAYGRLDNSGARVLIQTWEWSDLWDQLLMAERFPALRKGQARYSDVVIESIPVQQELPTPSAFTDQEPDKMTSRTPRRKRGPAPIDDAKHFEEMARLLEERTAHSYQKAATVVVDGGDVRGASRSAKIERLRKNFPSHVKGTEKSR